jgi:phage baseplate assembly protein W
MAFGARRIFPIDQRPGTAVGISIPFNAPGIFYSTYTTQDAIRNNLLNFFLTNKTERYLNNGFGSNLRAFVFEQITSGNLDFLKEDIQSQINQYFTNVQIDQLEILQYPDYNEINIKLFYSIINTGITDQIEITFT